ncbi:hypothetical protein C5167_042273, partial [Papaver somniferum]
MVLGRVLTLDLVILQKLPNDFKKRWERKNQTVDNLFGKGDSSNSCSSYSMS